jgi:hypothetical protein
LAERLPLTANISNRSMRFHAGNVGVRDLKFFLVEKPPRPLKNR